MPVSSGVSAITYQGGIIVDGQNKRCKHNHRTVEGAVDCSVELGNRYDSGRLRLHSLGRTWRIIRRGGCWTVGKEIGA
jgi:hypothetical protein